MKKVLVESPFAGRGETPSEKTLDRLHNIAYARRCLHDCFQRGEAPFASHLLYTQYGVLDDDIPEERRLGIDAGLVWGACADVSIFYLDRGLTRGMIYGLKEAIKRGRPIRARFLDEVQFDILNDFNDRLPTGEPVDVRLDG